MDIQGKSKRILVNNYFTYGKFDIIDWNLVERVINKKPQMYKKSGTQIIIWDGVVMGII